MPPRGWTRALVVLTWLACTVSAWWEVPHMLTAEVAKLTLLRDGHKQSYEDANNLVAVLAPYYPLSPDFVSAAVWADDIKRNDKRYSAWHYVDYPYLDGVTSGPPVPKENLVWALGVVMGSLSSGTHIPDTDNGKATAIRLLLHFLGDLHQPLHCSTRCTPENPTGDAGGNFFKVQDPQEHITNLHAFWDNGGGAWDGVTRDQLSNITAIAKGLIADHPASTLPYVPGDCNYTAWSLESFNLARTDVYVGIQYNGTVPAGYRANTQAIAAQQVVLGGLRLASCIDLAMTAARQSEQGPKNNTVSTTTLGAAVGAVGAVAVAAIVLAVVLGTRLKRRPHGPGLVSSSAAAGADDEDAGVMLTYDNGAPNQPTSGGTFYAVP